MWMHLFIINRCKIIKIGYIYRQTLCTTTYILFMITIVAVAAAVVVAVVVSIIIAQITLNTGAD